MKPIVLACLFAGLCLPAFSEPVASASDGFQIRLERGSEISPEEVFEKIGDLPSWWSSAHTYSGDAANLELNSMDPGGIWLETWEDGKVEHGRVIARFTQEDTQTIRFNAAFGPLQDIAANGVLTISVSPETDPDTPEQSQILFSYHVTGASYQKLENWAGPVDQVLTQQIDNLAGD